MKVKNFNFRAKFHIVLENLSQENEERKPINKFTQPLDFGEKVYFIAT